MHAKAAATQEQDATTKLKFSDQWIFCDGDKLPDLSNQIQSPERDQEQNPDHIQQPLPQVTRRRHH